MWICALLNHPSFADSENASNNPVCSKWSKAWVGSYGKAEIRWSLPTPSSLPTFLL